MILPPVAAVLLAAGGSRRAGRAKLLFPWRGTTLLRHAAAAALGSGADPVLCVLGCEGERLAAELAGLPLHLVPNDGWEEGLASSFRTALAALPELAAEAEGALFLLADQPLVGAPELARLLAHARGLAGPGRPLPLLASACGAGIGPPVLLPARLWPELAALRGDRGAREILERHRTELVIFDLPEAAYDVDREEDLAAHTALASRANA